MLRIIRQRFLTKALGGSFMSAVAFGWVLDKVKDIFDDDPEDIEKVVLKPGESYRVVARPAMSKREAKLFAQEQKLRSKAAKVNTPTAKEVKAANRLARSQKRVRKAKPGTKREEKRVRKLNAAEAKFDKVTKPSRRNKRRSTVAKELNSVSAERNQLAAIKRSQAVNKKRRRPRSKTYV